MGGPPIFGGVGGGSGSGTIGVPLSSILGRAYRIAGITKWVGTTPQADWFTEAIAECNAMLGTLNNCRLNIFTLAIDAFPIGGGKKAFTIGPGADFDMPYPTEIDKGVIVLSATTAGAVRMPPMHQMTDEEWANVGLQDVPNGVPLAFWFDHAYDPGTGWGTVNLWTQTTQAYLVEWWTWQSIPTFAAPTDLVALPGGYEDWLVYNLAERLAALNPHQAKMSADAYRIARTTRAAIQHINSPDPKHMISDSAGVGEASGTGRWDYRFGGFR